jgi:hypothetical protein
MARDCASCTAPFAAELDRQLRAGVPLGILAAWTASEGEAISAKAIGRHRRAHLGRYANPRGRRGASDDFLESVRDHVHARLEAGELQPGVRDGIAAQRALDAREAKATDRDWQLRLVLALTGNVPQRPRLVDHWDTEREAGEAEIRGLLTTGAD